MIINAGISKVIYEGDYPDDFSVELFKDAEVELIRYTANVNEGTPA
jgi:dCMP deaminase